MYMDLLIKKAVVSSVDIFVNHYSLMEMDNLGTLAVESEDNRRRLNPLLFLAWPP